MTSSNSGSSKRSSVNVEELKRDSKWKKMAFDEGMIRPFLLLVSMPQEARSDLASMLGINIACYSNDAHKEAWFMINLNRDGIQARANRAYRESLNPFARNCNWYEVLQRVACKAFTKGKESGKLDKHLLDQLKASCRSLPDSLQLCRDSSDGRLSHMEELFLEALAQLIIRTEMPPDEMVEDSHEEEENADSAGWTNGELFRLLVALDLHKDKDLDVNVTTWMKSKRETHKMDVFCIGFNVVTLPLASILILPLIPIGMHTISILFGSTPGILLPVVVSILRQRARLSVEGIRIEDYYPDQSDT